MLSADIRRRFIDFFRERGHQGVPSSSLVPESDPTLLFTNAGMVQFKRVFQGQDVRPYKRAVTCQKCVRAGGKHNDLEQVGHTDRHHTFFEMLGNFSFGDYFKKDAITFAWEFVTSPKYLGIEPKRIRVSVHHSDDEARKLWREIAGLADDRIYGLGDKDNFWQMADTGPCGPCSELHVDLRENGRGRDDVVALDDFVEQTEAGLFLEIWNLVFMQYDRQADGTLNPLPAPSVDTGEGLDRTTSVIQGVRSAYHTDLFLPLLRRAEEVIGKRYGGANVDGMRVVEAAELTPSDVSFRVLADHARAVAFLLADGVYPSNEGRGYVLRRILRRAVRHAYLLGRRSPTLVELVDEVATIMGEPYPELGRRREHLRDVTRAEEERFLETIEGGLVRMAELTSVSGEEAFRLYDTFGFPIDLTQIIADERKMPVDVAGFEKLLDQQRARSRAARKAGAGAQSNSSGPAVRRKRGEGWQKNKLRLRQRWVGYDETAVDTDILAWRRTDDKVGLLLRDNPFYAESGGQVSDVGRVFADSFSVAIDEVRKEDGKTAVFGPVVEGEFEPVEVRAEVNEPRRRDTERNHTATHLIHAALRKVLGTHVHQAGSVVSPEHLRFDFTHHQPVGAALLGEIEREVNAHVWEGREVLTEEMKKDDALKLGAMSLFGEKYGDIVRVVTVPDVSIELCGGTHVRTTGQIGLLKFVGESGVGSGVRRVEALTGPGAFAWFADQNRLLNEAAAKLGSTPEHLARKVEALSEEQRKLQKRVEELIKGGGAAAANVAVENGTSIAVSNTPTGDRNEIGAMVDAFRSKTPSGVTVIFATGDRPGIHVGVTDDLVARGVTAGDVVNRIAALTGGKGGGRPHFASAGAGDASRLGAAEAQAGDIVREVLRARPAGASTS
ncbi:MAG TPA: alanine--tRNA ligase [Gemmatimonadales bacterium]|jgi:alanyl-tRNA synthetase